jgi:transposase InsO family protein
VKYGFIAKHRAIWPTRTMCRVLGVSASGFYDWLGRPLSAREQENARLLKAIRLSHQASDGTYGSPQVYRDLRDTGETCSENRVAKLMNAAGIKARHKRRRAPGQLEATQALNVGLRQPGIRKSTMRLTEVSVKFGKATETLGGEGSSSLHSVR